MTNDTELSDTVVDVAAQEVSLPMVPGTAPHMTLGQLTENYEAIIRVKGIYYPAAYQFLKELGRGRQGIVFLGLRQGARGCVTRHAIKLFNPAIYPSPELYWTDMGRIAIQTSRLQAMQSPNLVSRDSYEETCGIGYLQMDGIDGVDMKQFLDGAHLATTRARSTSEEWARFTDVIFRLDGRKVCVQPGVAIYIMRMMLRGMEALNSAGFVHCDIKPGNVMIDRLGYVKLVDFGRAVLMGEKSNWLLGTPIYMAPEIHERKPPQIQSDIFSAGLVCLEMLRGESICDPALDEDELLRFKLKLAERLPGFLPDYVRQNDRLVHTLRKMLAADPADRFSSVSEVDSGPDGLLHVHKQLVHAGKDSEYGRELESYLSKFAT
ncbi:MAG: serine/threonine-protein kinase [bacterium]